MTIEYGMQLSVSATPIPGVLLVDLPVHGDNRGWFKENWQREKMTQLGLPDFGPVQNNISFNEKVGTTRGIHAEPWDKYISVASGRVFGAWVDLREGPSFGAVFTTELSPNRAIFVPRGVGNAFQTLEVGTAYTYLVNDHWSPNASYTFLNLADETAAIQWPIPLAEAELSDKDRAHPRLADVVPMVTDHVAVIGARGQLGQALARALPAAGFSHVDYLDRSRVDLAEPNGVRAFDWSPYRLIVNAAAYTNVDGAETEEGRCQAWAVNASAVSELAVRAASTGATLVHVSSDYVFDGSRPGHSEDEPFSPLGVYGQSKAAGDLAAATAPRHYIVRTSWVVGDGKNFVQTMRDLAERGVDPVVIDDQRGRLSFADDIAAAIIHLVTKHCAYGTYNVSNAGPEQSWADIAREVFHLCGHDPARVTSTTTAQYAQGRNMAPRPLNSVLGLGKIEATGFAPRTASEALATYLA